MLKLVRLTTEEQFKELKKGDSLLIKWVGRYRGNEGVIHHKIYNIVRNKEKMIIDDCGFTLMIDIEKYLKGEFKAKEIHLIQDEPEPEKVSIVGRRVTIKESFQYYYSGEHFEMPAGMNGRVIYDKDPLGKTLIQFTDNIHFDGEGRSDQIFLLSDQFDFVD